MHFYHSLIAPLVIALVLVLSGGVSAQEFTQEEFEAHKVRAEQGDARAMCGLAVMYATGEGVAKDPENALYWLRRSAESGYADAQFLLGMRYDEGAGGPQDFEQASRWWRKSAEQGHPDAHFKLGVTEEERAEQYTWLLLSAESGNAYAVKELHFYDGMMHPRDTAEGRRRAYEWLRAHGKQ